MSNPGGPPKKDPPHEPVPEAPADDREIGSVDELYGSAPNPFPSQSIYAEDPDVYGDDVRAPTPPPRETITEPVHVKPAHVEPAPVEPAHVEPAYVEPAYVEPVHVEPAPVEQLAARESAMPHEPEHALREAVGAAEPKRRTAKLDAVRADDDEPGPRSRRMVMLLGTGVLGLITIAVLVILGSVNSRRYEITCSADHVGAEQGRSFPPWGTQQMRGAEWKPIALPPNAECKARETEDRAELEGWYLEALLERTSTTLTTPHLIDQIPTPPPDKKPPPNILDSVSEQLQQALLLSRSPDRRDQRKEVERLMGDVQYWRASLRLRDASTALLDASKQFDQAAQQRPRHVTDASAWAQYVKKLADDLRAGPNGIPAAAQNFPPAPTTSDRPSAPAGTALPVETPPPQIEETPPPAPDAGVPTGGVLL